MRVHKYKMENHIFALNENKGKTLELVKKESQISKQEVWWAKGRTKNINLQDNLKEGKYTKIPMEEWFGEPILR